MKGIYVIRRSDEYLLEHSEDYVEHFGIPGMKWGKKSTASNILSGLSAGARTGFNSPVEAKNKHADIINSKVQRVADSYKEKAEGYKDAYRAYEKAIEEYTEKLNTAVIQQEKEAMKRMLSRLRSNAKKMKDAWEAAEKQYNMLTKK